MTTPPAPPAVPAAPAPAPPAAPPAPAPPAVPPAPAPAPAPPTPAPTAEDLARVTAALDAERTKNRTQETELTKLRQSSMSDAEKAIETARAEGRAEAEKASNLLLAAAEFRLQATGKITNPDAALAALDLAKLLGKDGKPDSALVGQLVTSLAAAAPAPTPGGHVPPGPRTPAAPMNGDNDWLRAVARPGRRRG